MGKTDSIFESIVEDDHDPTSSAPRGDPHVELKNTIDAKNRRTEAFLKLQQKYLDNSGPIEKRLYKLAGTRHPIFKKLMRLASQVMWDPRKYHEIMSESDTIVEAIMEDDNVIGGADRFRPKTTWSLTDPPPEPSEALMKAVADRTNNLRELRLRNIRADVWSLTTAMKLMHERRNGEALVHLNDMLESKQKEIAKLQSED